MDLKRGLIFFLILGILLISSCKSHQRGVMPTGGLELRFVPGHPPTQLKEGREFNVGLEITNNMEHPVNFELCIHDSTPDFYGGVPNTKTCENETIDRAYRDSNDLLTPKTETFYFPDELATYSYKELDKGVDSDSIYAELIYPVISNAGVDVCILRDPDIGVAEDSFNCNKVETFASPNIHQESAPIIISKIEKDINKVGGNHELSLDIYLSKTDDGEIVKTSDFELDLIDMRVSLVGTSEEFSCSPQREGKVVFRKGDKITCIGNLGGIDSDYKDRLNIELQYYYKMGKPFRIKFEKTYKDKV
jgi:hypothetical protein